MIELWHAAGRFYSARVDRARVLEVGASDEMARWVEQVPAGRGLALPVVCEGVLLWVSRYTTRSAADFVETLRTPGAPSTTLLRDWLIASRTGGQASEGVRWQAASYTMTAWNAWLHGHTLRRVGVFDAARFPVVFVDRNRAVMGDGSIVSRSYSTAPSAGHGNDGGADADARQSELPIIRRNMRKRQDGEL